MTETTNYHLKKPDDTDPTDQRPFNDNSDIIDEELAKRYTKEEIDGQEAVLLGEVTKNTAALTELIDNGAKNKLNHTAYTRTVNGVTYTVNADRSITITSDGTNTQSLLYLVQNYTGVPAENYVLSGCPGGSSTTYDLRVKVGSTTYINYEGGTEFTYNGTDSFESTIVVRANQTLNITMKPMVCTKAEWDISQSYEQYIPSNKELAESKIDVGLNAIPSGITLEAFADSLPLGTHICFYNSANNASDAPVNVHAIVEIHKYSSNTGDMTFNPLSTTYQLNEYRKLLTAGTWRDWVVFTGTAVT